jgi:putative ubiquitin-RnfH superfamily antitoxin RatB of RatAB toxin-antitoxin module
MPDLRIEIVYASPSQQTIMHMVVESGAVVQDVVERSGILRSLPSEERLSYGIFGRRVTPDRTLQDGDRIEIYRPLRVDPRLARRARASSTRRARR